MPQSFKLCLNTSTIRGANLSLVQQIDVAAQAGYQGIEPWLNTIHEYASLGGKLSEVAMRLSDYGLSVESGIGFAAWISDDDAKRALALEQLKRDMDAIQQLGGKRIAAPPSGIDNSQSIQLDAIGERYQAILALGREIGVTPMLEVWGHSAAIRKLPQCLYAASAANHPDACLLLDIYHLHKGGSGFEALSLLGPKAMQVIHLNDYPDSIPLEQLGDKDRVMPGDGDAPFETILPTLKAINPSMTLSLELFNRDIWKLPPLDAAIMGREKLQALINRFAP